MIRHPAARRAPLGLALVVLAGLAPGAAYAVPQPDQAKSGDEGLPAFDSREGQNKQVPSSVQRSARSLDRSLGTEGFVRLDPRTASPASVIKTDGTLTGPSDKDPAAVALDYVRAHATVFGLTDGEVDGLKLVGRTTSRGGTVHLVWQQQYQGVSVLDNGLRADVTRDGRLITIGGSPLRSLSLPSTKPVLTASQALATGREDADASMVAPKPDTSSGPVQPTTFSNGDSARLVVFGDPRGARLAWRLVVNASSTKVYDTVVDATNGRILRRNNIVKFLSVNAHDYDPGASAGGTDAPRSVSAQWLPSTASTLSGPNAHVVADPLDDIGRPNGDGSTPSIDPTNEIHAVNGNFLFSVQPFSLGSGDPFYCPTTRCTWNPTVGNSWKTNRDQTAAQLFFFLNTFHDHLAADPIDFGDTQSAGSRPDYGQGGFNTQDPILAQVDDGADTGKSNGTSTHLPDDNHLNNANMTTYPDGVSGYMQMYLFGKQFGQPFAAVSGADDASIVYHEYTHGLSNRLVTDSQGWGALSSAQAGAMGEAWSDWYALDLLAAQGYVNDTATPGEVRLGAYEEGNQDLIRTEALDCPVGSAATHCQKANGGGPGGYTYGDFGKIAGEPEVHADGEIWAQTLWQIRQVMDSTAAEMVMTDGMRLLPPEPTMLDARNGILAAATQDAVSIGQNYHDQLWDVFANRGMGYFASTLGSWDTHPVADFNPPPDPANGTGTVAGTVTGSDTGQPLADAVVGIGGHDSTFNGSGLDDTYTAQTDSSGAFSMSSVPVGMYPQLSMSAPGYSRKITPLTVAAGANNQAPATLQRDWTSSLLGGTVTRWTGPNYSGCGVDEAIDNDQSTTWSADVGSGLSLTVQLPRNVNITGYGIDPGAGCGDDDGASTKSYKVDWSSDGSTWQALGGSQATGVLGSSNNHRMNNYAASASAARYVRLTPTAPQASSADYIDISDFEVYGTKADSKLPPAVAYYDYGATDPTTATTAMFAAHVDAHGVPDTSVHFDYGTTPALGSSTADASFSAPKASAQVAGLDPNRTYYFQAVATNGDGTSRGPIDSLSTDAAAPTVVTGDASGVDQTSATLSGTVDPNGSSTSYYFEWGTTTSYGQRSADVDGGTGWSGAAVSSAAAGLQPGATYHFRVVAANAAGTSFGDDHTFATASPPTAPPRGVPPAWFTDLADKTAKDEAGKAQQGTQPSNGAPGPTQTTPDGGSAPTVSAELRAIKLSSSSVTASSSGLLQLLVTFPGSVPTQTGSATVTLSGSPGRTRAHARSRTRAAKVTKLGSARFKVTPGKRVRIRVRLSASGRRLLARRGTLKVRVQLRVKDRSRRALVKTVTVTIKKPKAKRGSRR